MHCNEQTLRSLLAGGDTPSHDASADETVAAAHLETCETCQTRMMQLAADEDSWHQSAVALNTDVTLHGSMVIAIDPGIPVDMPMQAEQIPLDFLDAPKHPEMLGRIGRYDVERLIGAGGMGIVLKAFDTELHRPVAVKVLAPHLAHSGGARQRFAREAQSAAAVVHENVVPIHDVNATTNLPYLVMQYVAGESLQTRVDRLGPSSVTEILRVGKQISAGLAAAHHEGLVHRDVKPGNILLEQSVDRVLISDFGLARAADDASMTRSGVIAGTPHYMSPEQARGNPIDFRSDLFGLGSVLYFMCTGHPPFRAEGAMGVLNRICIDEHRPVDQVNSRIPADLAELIDQLLEKEPAQRPLDAEAVESALKQMLHDTRSQMRFRRTVRKNANAGWMIAGALTVGAVMIAGLSMLPTTDESPRQAIALQNENGNGNENDSTDVISTKSHMEPAILTDAPPSSDSTLPADNFYMEAAELRQAIREFESWELAPQRLPDGN